MMILFAKYSLFVLYVALCILPSLSLILPFCRRSCCHHHIVKSTSSPSSLSSSSSSSSSSISSSISSSSSSLSSSSCSDLLNKLNHVNQSHINHVAFIVDGNGRWAEERGESRIFGHIQGANNTIEIVKESFKYGINFITLYLFSTENWKRPKEEVNNIMSLLEKYLVQFNSYLKENRIRVRVIGQTYRLPSSIQSLISNVGYNDHDSNNERVLVLALSYGGRDDIVQATKRVCNEIVSGKKRIEDIDEDFFSSQTSTGLLSIPDPDVIIRTSGEMRLSNFLLWQLAYSEFISVPKKWPDFHANECIELYQAYGLRERRFGDVSTKSKLS